MIWFYGLNYFKPAFALWVVESVRWVLIVGNLAAIVVGILLAFYPQRLAALESGGARWYSERYVVKGRDEMNLTFDRWVTESPRASGWIMTLCGLVLVGIFGSLLPATI